MTLKQLKKKAAAFAEQLQALADEANTHVEEQSDGWEASDAGVDFMAAVDALESAVAELDGID